jgi:hypothetical protein
MNIFVLDLDCKLAAQYHPDKLVVKMPTETLQMLVSTILKFNPDVSDIPIAKTSGKPYRKIKNMGHGARVWSEKSEENFKWLCELGLELCKEYQYRYKPTQLDQNHYSLKGILWCQQNVPNLPKIGLTPFYLGMPDKYHSENVVESYRNYIKFEKSYAQWTKTRPAPKWYAHS